MEDRYILGLTENVTIVGRNEKEVVGRVDTGATSSSIDINLAGELELGPIIQSKLVKSASGIDRRPAVLAKVKINGDEFEAEFTLADRSHMTYSVLIGQNILKQGKFFIDPLKSVDKSLGDFQ